MDYAEYEFRWLRKTVGVTYGGDGYAHPRTVDVLQYRKVFVDNSPVKTPITQWIDVRKEDENGQVCY